MIGPPFSRSRSSLRPTLGSTLPSGLSRKETLIKPRRANLLSRASSASGTRPGRTRGRRGRRNGLSRRWMTRASGCSSTRRRTGRRGRRGISRTSTFGSLCSYRFSSRFLVAGPLSLGIFGARDRRQRAGGRPSKSATSRSSGLPSDCPFPLLARDLDSFSSIYDTLRALFVSSHLLYSCSAHSLSLELSLCLGLIRLGLRGLWVGTNRTLSGQGGRP